LEFLFRFLIGGIVVSMFAVLGDVLKPKSFAGLFGAAPSVALATLSLTIVANGKAYVATEARSMIVGAIAFFIYSCACTRLMARHKVQAAPATIGALVLWLGCALAAWGLFLK
jgi:uncharacterized membrane protein (GlpM family)